MSDGWGEGFEKGDLTVLVLGSHEPENEGVIVAVSHMNEDDTAEELSDAFDEDEGIKVGEAVAKYLNGLDEDTINMLDIVKLGKKFNLNQLGG